MEEPKPKVAPLSDWEKKKLEQLHTRLEHLPPGTVKTMSVETIRPGIFYWLFRDITFGCSGKKISDYQFLYIGVFKTILDRYYVLGVDKSDTFHHSRTSITLRTLAEYISNGFIYENSIEPTI